MRRSVNGVSEYHNYHHMYETTFAVDPDDTLIGIRRKVAEISQYPVEHQVCRACALAVPHALLRCWHSAFQAAQRFVKRTCRMPTQYAREFQAPDHILKPCVQCWWSLSTKLCFRQVICRHAMLSTSSRDTIAHLIHPN